MKREWSKLQRRDFLKSCAAVAAGSVLPGYGIFNVTNGMAAPVKSAAQKTGNLRDILPIIGTGWHGHTFPGAVAPFGLVQLSPDTSGPREPKWDGRFDVNEWNHSAGYHYPDNVVLGFSHTHVQGTGAGELGDVLVMPMVEGRNWGWEAGAPWDQAQSQITALGLDSGWVFNPSEQGYRSFFSHQHEDARAGYYSVHLETPDVHAELTATTRCGMHRYRYPTLPAETRQAFMVDLAHSVGSKVYHAELNIESNSRISGSRSTHGWAKDKHVYFVLEFSHPPSSIEVMTDGTARPAAVGDKFSGQQIKAIFTHASGSEPRLIRVGISGTGIEGARKNLAAEIPHWDFDAIAHQTQDAWTKALGALEAELATESSRQNFWSGAYHGMVAPMTYNDVDGAYRGQDGKNHPNPGFTKYTSLSIWDIYRGEFPFLMMTQPHRANEIIQTMLLDYQQLDQHMLPVWPLWGNETWSMTGFHSAGMIAGAYVRGIRDYDVEAVYAAMRDTALVGAKVKDNQELQRQFRHYGYVPTGPKKQAVSRTLDFAYDYWCVGAMAELLGKHDDAAMFYKLSQNYKNIFDPKTGFMRGKTEDGQWREPFRPDEEVADYTESDAWQATFNVMQDVQGLIDLYGGDAQFIAKLDALFTAPSNVYNSPPDITGMVGQDAQGNEPSNHIPYLYPFAGAAWKTQQWVRKVSGLYENNPSGIPGNDDCGQLSTWFVFAALGFYPVNAVNGVYVIGSPLVSRARIKNPGKGTTFTIVADNNSAENMFIQGAKLNGKELTRSWLTHAEIAAGGELHFRMGGKPNKEWASAPVDRPPSGLVKS